MKATTRSQKNIVTEKWLDGIAYEIAFWNNVYRWPHTFKGMMGWALWLKNKFRRFRGK